MNASSAITGANGLPQRTAVTSSAMSEAKRL